MRPEILYPYFTDLAQLKGIGKKTRERLVKLCGENIIDLLFHLPRELLSRRRSDDLQAGVHSVQVQIQKHRPASRRGVPHVIEALILCENTHHHNHQGRLEVVYFHARGDYLRKSFPDGETRLISGKLEYRRDHWIMLHPDYVVTPEEADTLPKLEPIYGLIQGLTNRLFRQAVSGAIRALPPLPEWHSEKVIIDQQWPDFLSALRHPHQPETHADLQTAETRSPALRRLAMDELLAHQLSLRFMRQRYRRRAGLSRPETHLYRAQVEAALPFNLSETQNHAIAEIRADMQDEEPMLRLLMGEVGSGKTLVALMIMLDILESGAKCAMMVPSETLARQHQETIQETLQQAGLDIPCVLLVSSLGAAAKREVLGALAGSEPLIAIGTHALIQDAVVYENLGLVIIDEQHRFGVHQRMALSRKASITPEMLVMTATPIPRTLLMTHYGDLDSTRLEGRNPNASEVQTAVIGDHKIDALVQRISAVLERKERIFWVCPLREDSEKIDLAAAQSRYDHLKTIFPDQCFLLHGGMTTEAKVETMQTFQAAPNGAILIATTVIEVGIDIHDATVIIIEAAEHFGLAQLHQLRGRVGRSKLAGNCILLHGAQMSKVAQERLEMMRNSTDGFALAEADLRLRGGGEILGAKQSGVPMMRLANLAQDQDLLKRAHDEAAYIVQHDPKLQGSRGKALRILLYLFRRDAALTLINSG